MEYDPNDNEKKSKEEKKADSQNSSDDKAGKEGGIEFGEEVDQGSEEDISMGGDNPDEPGSDPFQSVEALIIDLKGSDDVISFGEGNETLVIGKGNGRDVITDFDLVHDTLDFSELGFDSFEDVINAAKEVGVVLTGNKGVFIDLGDGNSITLDGLSIEDLSKANIDLF
jgi:hypothetical protein